MIFRGMKHGVTAVLILMLALNLSACGKDKTNKRSIVVTRDAADGGADKVKTIDEVIALEDVALKDLNSSLGLRSFEQIKESMAVVTGVRSSAANVQAIYQEVKTQLPTNNDIKTFIASQQVGISKMAVEFCDVMVDTPNLRTSAAPNFNFSQSPNQAFSGAGAKNLVQGFMASFWGTNLSSVPDDNVSVQLLEGLVDDLLVGSNMGDPAVTLGTAKGICTAVLSASPVTTF